MPAPTYQQVLAAREQHPDTVLIFRQGEVCELIGTDALTGRSLLKLTVSVRDGIAVASFPTTDMEQHLRRLLKAKHRVAVCDQVEADQVPLEQVQRILTPGAMTEDRLVE